MIIRDMTLQDRENFLAMVRDFYDSGAALHGFREEIPGKNLNAFLSGNPYLRCLMLESSDGITAGYALLSLSWTTEYGGPLVILEELYLCPDMRGRGLAGAFFRWLFTQYDTDAAAYRLEVAPGNAQVMDIYRKYGYETLEYIQMIRTEPLKK